jgi:probable HAF family extracellular repeat protein
MKFLKPMRLAAIICALTALSLPTPAQEGAAKHHHYKLFDLGSFGGPGAPGGGFDGNGPSSPQLNQRGMSVGALDSATPDPNGPNMCFFDCQVDIAFVWKNGAVTPLPPLREGKNLSSYALGINNLGQIAGQAQNGATDFATGWPELRAVLWHDGRIIDLGTLGGTQSTTSSLNDFGQVVGTSLTGTPDPFADDDLLACQLCSGGTFAFNFVFAPATTETRAFVWQNGFMRDLGTLGGPDSTAWINNDRGEVAGWSFTSFTANPSTGVPTVDPFFWSPEGGRMIDMGGLGGTYGLAMWMNNFGQVVGASNVPGDGTEHPFIWSKSTGMVDLFLNGGLGGDFGHPDWVNDAGEVVGFSVIPDTASCPVEGHGFLWRNGVMTDLGTVDNDPTSEGFSINLQGQVVGQSYDFCSSVSHGFLWENGGPAVDVNTLVLSGTTMNVIAAVLINDRGEIGCTGTTAAVPNEHPCMLIPCDENHPDIEGCDYSLVESVAPAEVHSTRTTQKPVVPASQDKLSEAEIIAKYRQFFANRHRRFARATGLLGPTQ